MKERYERYWGYERHWIVRFYINGFESKMLVYGTEYELREYLTSEIGYIPGYCGATDKEVKAAKLLGMKIYCCPKIR